jgi:hypothetical protein
MARFDAGTWGTKDLLNVAAGTLSQSSKKKKRVGQQKTHPAPQEVQI